MEQDGRWGKSDEKLIAKLTKDGKFHPILNTKISLKKVNVEIISKWVTEKLIEILGFGDEIIVNLVVNLLSADVSKFIVYCTTFFFIILQTHCYVFYFSSPLKERNFKLM